MDDVKSQLKWRRTEDEVWVKDMDVTIACIRRELAGIHTTCATCCALTMQENEPRDKHCQSKWSIASMTQPSHRTPPQAETQCLHRCPSPLTTPSLYHSRVGIADSRGCSWMMYQCVGGSHVDQDCCDVGGSGGVRLGQAL